MARARPSTGFPASWAELFERFRAVNGSTLEEAQEWLREALDHNYQVNDLMELSRGMRALVLQKMIGTLLRLEDEGEIAFLPDVRRVIGESFALSWGGFIPQGPPWRISPAECDRPTYAEHLAAASSFFGAGE